jgi:soluble lytic murein transglycosylase-like protein
MALAGTLVLSSWSRPAARSGPADGSFLPASDRAQSLYADAAVHVRGRDCNGARALLDPSVRARGADAPFSALLSGFYAHVCQLPSAEQELFSAADPSGLLEDWRLLLLSQAAAARGHQLVARAALAKLLGDYPASPLRPRALVTAATLEWQNGDARKALDLIAQGRREGLSGDLGRDADKLAWEIGRRQNDRGVQVEAARRLLVDHPATAAELGVLAAIQQGPVTGTLGALGGAAFDWSSFLSGQQLIRRAESLLGMGLLSNALAALDAVSPADRNLAWQLLKAQALTASRRGGEALSLLASVSAASPGDGAAVEWARAAAMSDLVRGGARAAVGDRAELRQLYRQHLQRVVQINGDPELSAKALRSLYTELWRQDLYDLAIDSLRQLRKLDPRDTTGADDLWRTGWGQFQGADYPRAIHTWSDLSALYPEDAGARRGQYWSARAFEIQGEQERARQIYAAVASSDTTDFYSKYALVRLGGGSPGALAANAGKAGPLEAWPNDPALGRTRLLSDLGLEPLAWQELELVRERAEPRAAKALQALLLARQGDRRKSIVSLREAFPALGTPFQRALPEEALKLYYPLDYQGAVRTWASYNQLPMSLVLGVIRQESAFDRFATSSAGARGLMQLMPATARELASHAGLGFLPEKMHDPEFNLRLGTTYLRQVLAMFGDNVELGLAGYNGGPYRIKRMWQQNGSTDLDRFLESLSIEESKVYVKRILLLSDSYRRLYPQVG